MQTAEQPLISCLCISNNRPDYLKKAIECFCAQTYTNKELVIVTHTLNYEKVVGRYPSENIKLHKVDLLENLTLGDLRNHAISSASGEFICNWDDDDWSHPMRLESQLAASMSNYKKGSLLAYCLMYDAVNGKSYLSYPMFHPASVFCKKDHLIENDVKYSSLNKDEDDPFIAKLHEQNTLFAQVNPSLYIYVFHGKNTWDNSHFQKMYALSAEFSDEISTLIGQIVNHQYSCSEAAELLGNPDVLAEFDYFKAFAMRKKLAAN